MKQTSDGSFKLLGFVSIPMLIAYAAAIAVSAALCYSELDKTSCYDVVIWLVNFLDTLSRTAGVELPQSFLP